MGDATLDDIDRSIVNELQDGFPVAARPYRTVARRLRLEESELIARLKRLLRDGVLTRFGPLFQIERGGGQYVLCAMAVAPERIGEIAAILARMQEVAHNYERAHEFNVWFVVAGETPEHARAAIERIETSTGLPVLQFPKLREFHVDLRFRA